MNLFKISWSNLKVKPLSSLLSLILLSLGVGIISLLLNFYSQFTSQFNKNIEGIDMVVGAKGSPMQLILSSIYHIDAPTGNIKLSEAQRLEKNLLVKSTIKMSYGDSYMGYRIVGTEKGYPEHYGAKIAQGKEWEKDFEVTVGSHVAKTLGLKLGDTFFGTHGLAAGDDGEVHGHVHEEFKYVVTGIYEPSGTVIDQLILCTLESVWLVHGEHDHDHDHEGHDHEDGETHSHEDHAHDEHDGEAAAHDHEGHNHDDHDHEGHDHDHAHDHEHSAEEDREITAMLVKFRNPMGIMQLPRYVNTQTEMQAALPSFEVPRLFNLLSVGITAIRAIAIAIMLISGISVFISLFNSLKDRKYELALMRSMGASRGKLLLMILMEGLILSIFGYAVGWGLGKIGMMIISGVANEDYHYDLEVFRFTSFEGILLLVTLGIGIFAALIPALRAFNLNISKTLAED